MRRREFLATVLGAVTLVGCSASRSTHASSASTPSIPATPITGMASPTPPVATPGTPGEVLQRSTVPALCYHQIREHTAADSAGARSFIVPPAVLERHLQTLATAGMQPITSTALVDHLELGAPARPAGDDHIRRRLRGPLHPGAADPATAGHAGDLLRHDRRTGQADWLRRDQVRRLDRAGMTIGAHTWDHHRVTTYTDLDWATQLDRPKAELEDIVGHRLDLFAYPYGAWNPAALPHVQQAGYRAAFQLTDQPPDPRRPLFTIRRVLTSSSWDTATLLTRLRS